MNKLSNYIHNIIHKPAVRISFLFMVGSTAANVGNWIFNVMAGRALSNEEFAVLTVFLSMFSILMVPANAIATTVSRYAAFQLEAKNDDVQALFLKHYSTVAWVFGLVFTGIFILGSGFIKHYFALPNISYILLFSVTILLLFLVAFQRGILKAHLLLAWVGMLMATEALIKVLTITAVMVFDLPTLPFMIGSLPLSIVVSLLVSKQLTKNIASPVIQLTKRAKSVSFADTYSFLANSFIASIGMVLLNGIDVLLVKHYFDPAVAGTYAILALFGKILFFGGGSLIELFIPFVARANGKGETGLKQFLSLVFVVGSIAGVTLLAFLLFPEPIVRLFIGAKALSVLPYLRLYSIGVFFLILISCFNVFNIAKKDFTPSRLIVVAVLIEAVLIAFNHQTLIQVVSIVTYVNLGLFIIILLYSFIKRNNTGEAKQVKFSQNIFFLMLLSLQNIVKRSNQTIITPPKKILNYSFVKKIETPGLKRPHVIALYRNKAGQKAVAKIWQGKVKNVAYYALKNEAHMYQLFTNVVKRKNIPKKIAHISHPQLLAVIEKDTTFILLTEFSKGEVAVTLKSTKKLPLYLDCVAYIRFIGDHLTTEERASISKRTVTDYILLFPLIFAVSVVRQPKHIMKLLKGMYLFIQALPKLFAEKQLVLTHRDLHFHNIIVNKGKAAILDLQRCIYTFELYEYVTTLPIEWNEEVFRKALLNYSVNQSKEKTGSDSALKGLMANFSIHGLTANNLPAVNIQRFYKMLVFTLN